jgi:hypothetical protein
MNTITAVLLVWCVLSVITAAAFHAFRRITEYAAYRRAQRLGFFTANTHYQPKGTQ